MSEQSVEAGNAALKGCTATFKGDGVQEQEDEASAISGGREGFCRHSLQLPGFTCGHHHPHSDTR